MKVVTLNSGKIPVYYQVEPPPPKHGVHNMCEELDAACRERSVMLLAAEADFDLKTDALNRLWPNARDIVRRIYNIKAKDEIRSLLTK